MIQFAKPIKSQPLHDRWLFGVSYGLGLWTTGIAAAQMASFEDFVNALRGFQLTGARGTLVLAIGLLAVEIFSTPFLLRLPLSRAAHFASALLGLAAPIAWILLLLLATAKHAPVDNAGYFGGLLNMPASAALLVSVAWAIVAVSSFGALGGWRALRGR